MPLLNKMYGILKIADITLPGFQTENVKKMYKIFKGLPGLHATLQDPYEIPGLKKLKMVICKSEDHNTVGKSTLYLT